MHFTLSFFTTFFTSVAEVMVKRLPYFRFVFELEAVSGRDSDFIEKRQKVSKTC